MDFQTAFLQCYGITYPVVTLGRLPHWVGIKDRFNQLGMDLDNKQVYIPDGYFYAVNTHPPSLESIQKFKENAKSMGAEGVLIPCVRASNDTDEIFAQLGGRKVSSSPEIIVNIDSSPLDGQLSSRITRLRYRDMCRLVRKAEKSYLLQEYESQSKGVELAVKDIAMLHAMHAQRYQSPTDIFREQVLSAMVHADKESELHLFVRRSKETGCPVQGMITFWDQKVGSVVYLSQAIDRDSSPIGYNFYRSSFLELYRLAQQRGYSFINLGRGNAEVKVSDLGGSQVIPQNHWVFI